MVPPVSRTGSSAAVRFAGPVVSVKVELGSLDQCRKTKQCFEVVKSGPQAHARIAGHAMFAHLQVKHKFASLVAMVSRGTCQKTQQILELATPGPSARARSFVLSAFGSFQKTNQPVGRVWRVLSGPC